MRPVRAVASETHCALIDLHAMSRVLYQALGADLDKAFQDGTHHNNYGSYELAKCVITGIQQAKLPLARAIAADFGHFDPSKPDPVAAFAVASLLALLAVLTLLIKSVVEWQFERDQKAAALLPPENPGR